MAIQEIVVVYHLQGGSGSSTVCEDAKQNPWWYVAFSLVTCQLLHNPRFTDHNAKMMLVNFKMSGFFFWNFPIVGAKMHIVLTNEISGILG